MDALLSGNPDNLFGQRVTIAAGGSASEMVATGGKALIGIYVPSAWTAADIGFKVTHDGNPNSLVTVQTSGGDAHTAVAEASTYIAFPTVDAVFGPFLQIVSVAAGGQSTTPEVQVAERILFLVFRRLFS